MAKQFPALTEAHRAFIARQHIFFVASSARGSRVNISPRGAEGFRVLDESRVAYLDRTGSGHETAAHIRAGGPLTIMFCALTGTPMIMRLYGTGTAHPVGGGAYAALLDAHFAGQAPPGARQIVELAVGMVQTSCGFGVPLFDYRGERPTLDAWAEAKGPDGLEAYRRQKNVRSIDGLATGLLEEDGVGA